MPAEEVENITPYLKIKTLVKDEYLLSENQTCNFIAFIKYGSFRHFHMNANGSSTNIWLSSGKELISDYMSFKSGMPSNISIQAIEKTEVILLHKNDFHKLLENSLYWNTLGRLMIENSFMLSIMRLESIIYKTPEERYLDLITQSPEFLEKYALTDIASFIGVTVQSLSRIRARV